MAEQEIKEKWREYDGKGLTTSNGNSSIHPFHHRNIPMFPFRIKTHRESPKLSWIFTSKSRKSWDVRAVATR